MATFASSSLAKSAADTETETNNSTAKSAAYEPKKLVVNEISSLFQLKNELLKKKNDIAGKSTSNNVKKGGILAVKKEEKVSLTAEARERKRRIEHQRVLDQEERDRLEKSARKLQEKSELYEKLSSGSLVLHHPDETPVEFLVDFGQKKREAAKEEDKPSTSKDPTSVVEHFEPDEESRVYGVSHMKFSSDEEKRKKEIKDLMDMSEETEKNRLKRQKALEKKEAEKQQRLSALRARLGMPEPKKPSPPPEPVYLDIPLPATETVEEKFQKKLSKTREWDEGKGAYDRWIKKQREEREDEFRPPDSYFR